MKWTLMILLLSFSTVYGPPLPGCSVTAEVGGTVILPVKVILPENSELFDPIINWKTERGDIVHDYWYVKDDNTFQGDHFKGRTSLFKEEIKKGNVSLKIINVTTNDTGKYTCEVHNQDTKSYKVSLCVREKREDSTESPNPEQPDLSQGQIVGVLIVLAVLIGVTVFLYIKLKATVRTYDGDEVDNQEMETLEGGRELVYFSEEPMSICAQQQIEEYTNKQLLKIYE